MTLEELEALPDLSVVATYDKVWIKSHPTPFTHWRGTNGGYYSNLSLSVPRGEPLCVLRVGNGTGEAT